MDRTEQTLGDRDREAVILEFAVGDLFRELFAQELVDNLAGFGFFWRPRCLRGRYKRLVLSRDKSKRKNVASENPIGCMIRRLVVVQRDNASFRAFAALQLEERGFPCDAAVKHRLADAIHSALTLDDVRRRVPEVAYVSWALIVGDCSIQSGTRWDEWRLCPVACEEKFEMLLQLLDVDTTTAEGA